MARTQGSKNKVTNSVKSQIETALRRVSRTSTKKHGVSYLERMAEEHPAAFLGLVGKLIPRNLSIDANVNVNIADAMLQAGQRLKDKSHMIDGNATDADIIEMPAIEPPIPEPEPEPVKSEPIDQPPVDKDGIVDLDNMTNE